MARFRTTLVQVSGYNFLKNRITRAFQTRDNMDVPSEPSAFKKCAGLGLAAFVVIGGAGKAVGFFDKGSNALGDSKYVVTADGTQYVNFKDTWHSVENTASARLIIGAAENPTSIKPKALDGQPMGQMMGILGAPGNFTRRDDEISEWSVCTQYTPASRTNLLDTTSVDSIIIAGSGELDNRAQLLNNQESVVVKNLDTGEYWIVLSTGQKMRVAPNDERVMNALALSREDIDKATNVSSVMLESLDTLPDLDTPQIEGDGGNSTAISDYRIGTVLSVDMPNSKDFFMVGDKGVQRINPFIARWVATTGGTVLDNISPDKASSYPSTTGVIDTARYPTGIPKVNVGKSVCSVWTKESSTADAKRSVFVASTLPMEQKKADNAAELLPSAGTKAPTANFSYTSGGKGWFVRTTGSSNDSLEQGALFWISDAGVAYPIGSNDEGSFDDTVSALGIGGQNPNLIPQGFLDRYTLGPTLSPERARTLHADPSEDPAQQAVSDDKE